MAITKTQVIGTVVLPDGTIPTEGRVIFALKGWDADMDPDGGIVLPAPVTCDLGGDGQVSVQLFTNSEGLRGVVYDVTIEYLDDRLRRPRTPLGAISLVGPGPHALRDLLQVPALEPTAPSILAQVIAVQGLVDAAVAEATGAAGAAAEAAGAAGDAASAAAGSAEAAAELVETAETAVQPEDLGTAAFEDVQAFYPGPVRDPCILFVGGGYSLLDYAVFGQEGNLLFAVGVDGTLPGLEMATRAELAAAEAGVAALERLHDTAVAVPVYDPTVLRDGRVLVSATFSQSGQFLGGELENASVRADGAQVGYDPVVAEGRVLSEAEFSADGVLQRGLFADGQAVRAAFVRAEDPRLPKVPRWSRPTNKIVGITPFGQSLNLGRAGFPFSGLRNADPKRILMPDIGATSGEWDSYFEPIRRLVPYRPSKSEAANAHGEHGLQGILHQLFHHNDGQNLLVGCAFGRGGTDMASLLSATHWDQVTSFVTQMTALASAMGKEFEVGLFPVMHGSADDGDLTAEEYAGLLDQLDAKVQALTAITGQSESIPILIDQLSALPSGGADSVASGQVLAALRNPNIHLSMGRPDAAYRYLDGTHWRRGEDYIHHGERMGICGCRLLAGADSEPLWIKKVEVSDAVAVLSYPEQHGDLVLDYDRGRPKNASAGYEAVDDAGALAIESVTVHRSKVTLVFDRAATSGLRIRNAWDAAVSRTATALRNQQVETSEVDGDPLYFWGISEEYDVDKRSVADTLDTLDPEVTIDASGFDGTTWSNNPTAGFNGPLGDLADGPFDGLSRPTLTASDATLNNLPTVAFPGELASPAFDASADVYLTALLKPKSGTTGTVFEMRDAAGDGFHIYVDGTAGALKIQVQNNTARTITSMLDAWVLFSVQILWRQMDPYLRIQLYGAAETVYELTTPMAAVDDAVLTIGAPHPTSTGGQAGSADFDLSDLIFGPGETNYLLVEKLFGHLAAKASI